MRVMAGVVLVFALAPTVSAKEHILCKRRGEGTDAFITMGAFSKFERDFNCVYGDFGGEAPGCAPDGAFGLWYPTGGSELREVVDRWQNYKDHLGEVTGNSINDVTIEFTAGFNSLEHSYQEIWRFSANRFTGVATLTRPDEPPVVFDCAKAAQKF